MIQDAKAENLAGFGQLLMHAQVSFAGLKVAGWVVVREDHSGGPVGNYIGKDLTRVNRAFVEQANRNDTLFYDFIRAVERPARSQGTTSGKSRPAELPGPIRQETPAPTLPPVRCTR